MSTAATKRAPVATVIPKPCLKQALKLVSTACSQTKHAHFPPPSEEAKRYSGIEYDRTPIVVLTNELALPERGCPGRTFDDLDAHRYRHRTHHKSLSSVSEGSIPSSSSSTANLGLPLSRTWPSSAIDAAARNTIGLGAGAEWSPIYGDTSDLEDESGSSAAEGRQLYLKATAANVRGSRRLKKAHRSSRNMERLMGSSTTTMTTRHSRLALLLVLEAIPV
ncbi:hypothetical protein FRC14_001227 [Serendipita sp. 396]|nr:hypothetical protein FRC14_001227 [Serendipita sp. 396]